MVKIEQGYLTIDSMATVDGVLCLVVACNDYDHFKSLPAVVSHNGWLCGKTGWNSDSGRAYYQSNVAIAKVV